MTLVAAAAVILVAAEQLFLVAAMAEQLFLVDVTLDAAEQSLQDLPTVQRFIRET